MAADDPTNPLDAITLSQNPSPFPETGQDFLDKVRLQTSAILAQFIKVLPSNYVSRTTGPFYTLQFQAAAEQLAVFQVTAQEVFKDADYDYTRPEFLWEVLGSFVFPEATTVPTVDGDQAYRTFLKKMVLLLLRGATPGVMQEGAELLTEADVLLLERFLEAREPGSAFTIDDQFFVDLLVEEGGGTSFPAQPFVLQENVRLILKALKPAHVLYSYSHLFRETFGTLFVDTYSWEMSAYYYDDFRKFCYGAKEITGLRFVRRPGRCPSPAYRARASKTRRAQTGPYARDLLQRRLGRCDGAHHQRARLAARQRSLLLSARTLVTRVFDRGSGCDRAPEVERPEVEE